MRVRYGIVAIALDHELSILDEGVLQIAVAEQRILITNDLDFGELVVREGLPHAGIILFRLPLDTAADEKIRRLPVILSRLKTAGTDHPFVVVRARSMSWR